MKISLFLNLCLFVYWCLSVYWFLEIAIFETIIPLELSLLLFGGSVFISGVLFSAILSDER